MTNTSSVDNSSFPHPVARRAHRCSHTVLTRRESEADACADAAFYAHRGSHVSWFGPNYPSQVSKG